MKLAELETEMENLKQQVRDADCAPAVYDAGGFLVPPEDEEMFSPKAKKDSNLHSEILPDESSFQPPKNLRELLGSRNLRGGAAASSSGAAAGNSASWHRGDDEFIRDESSFPKGRGAVPEEARSRRARSRKRNMKSSFLEDKEKMSSPKAAKKDHSNLPHKIPGYSSTLPGGAAAGSSSAAAGKNSASNLPPDEDPFSDEDLPVPLPKRGLLRRAPRIVLPNDNPFLPSKQETNLRKRLGSSAPGGTAANSSAGAAAGNRALDDDDEPLLPNASSFPDGRNVKTFLHPGSRRAPVDNKAGLSPRHPPGPGANSASWRGGGPRLFLQGNRGCYVLRVRKVIVLHSRTTRTVRSPHRSCSTRHGGH